jgi:hypothetical protein
LGEKKEKKTTTAAVIKYTQNRTERNSNKTSNGFATYHILYVHDKSYKIGKQTMYCEWQ